MSETSWRDVAMSELPTGTVTLLLADVEGSTRLWESQPEVMKAAVARLDSALSDAVTNHNGVRPVGQGDGDSFVIAFARAVDAVGCALALQHAPLAPIKLRIGIHTAIHLWAALAPLACGDIAAARRWADEVVSGTSGWSYAAALLARARVKIVQNAFDAAERDAYDGLDLAGRLQGDLLVPVALDCLATTAARADSFVLATRLFGAADEAYRRMGMVRFQVLEADNQSTLASLRESLGDSVFEAAWTEGTALSTGDAVGYGLRGRGERKRASSGWGSLTCAELDVVKLIGEGLGNKDIAARLLISPRTVQAHLTHIYTKLAFTSRQQLAQEAAWHVS